MDAMTTTHTHSHADLCVCVPPWLQVYCDTPVDQCAAWNKERPAEEQYEEKV